MPCPEPDRAHPGLLTGNRKKTTAITACATLRVRCKQIGDPLGDKLHDGDRWIANRTFANNLNDQSGDIIASTDSLNNLVGKFAAQPPVLDRAIKTLPEAVAVLNDRGSLPHPAAGRRGVPVRGRRRADAQSPRGRSGGQRARTDRRGGQHQGYREILGLDVTTAEDGAGWLTFWRSLTARSGWWPWVRTLLHSVFEQLTGNSLQRNMIGL